MYNKPIVRLLRTLTRCSCCMYTKNHRHGSWVGRNGYERTPGWADDLDMCVCTSLYVKKARRQINLYLRPRGKILCGTYYVQHVFAYCHFKFWETNVLQPCLLFNAQFQILSPNFQSLARCLPRTAPLDDVLGLLLFISRDINPRRIAVRSCWVQVRELGDIAFLRFFPLWV